MSHVLIPPSTIQQIVENEVENGLNNVTKNGQISVIIKRKNDMIKISVEDNGIGFTKEELNKLAKHRKSETSNGGVGLYNVNQDRKSTRLNSSHVAISYAVFCLKKKKRETAVRSGPPGNTN